MSISYNTAFSALTLLVGWQEGHPAVKKTEWLGSDMVIFLERGADLHMAQLMPLPLTVSCFGKIQIGFPVLVPARRQMCVCVCVCSYNTEHRFSVCGHAWCQSVLVPCCQYRLCFAGTVWEVRLAVKQFPLMQECTILKCVCNSWRLESRADDSCSIVQSRRRYSRLIRTASQYFAA